MTRLSRHPAERALQRYILAFVGWLLLAVVVLGTAGFVALGTEEGVGDWVPARAGFGTVFSLISLWLPVLVRRHSGDISRIHGLKGQYLGASAVTALVPAAAVSFMWWASLPATLVGLVSLVMAARVAKLPAEQMTETIGYLEPAGTEELGPGFFGGRFGFLKAILLGLLFGVAIIVAVVLLGP